MSGAVPTEDAEVASLVSRARIGRAGWLDLARARAVALRAAARDYAYALDRERRRNLANAIAHARARAMAAHEHRALDALSRQISSRCDEQRVLDEGALLAAAGEVMGQRYVSATEDRAALSLLARGMGP